MSEVWPLALIRNFARVVKTAFAFHRDEDDDSRNAPR
jgi:hypothetical protein